jgi:hypothetical protein
MQVTPVSRSLAEVFRGNFLRIPRFQRPYSWDKENLSDFWFDLVERHGDDYFMGSMVLYKDGKEANLFYVVDGQQRATTITLTLAVIRDSFDEFGEPDLANGVHNLLESKDLDNKPRFTLEHEPANSYFQHRIQQRNPDRTAGVSAPEEQALQDARVFIANAMKSYLETNSSHLTGTPRVDAKIELLKKLRDRVLALQFISISLTNEDDAYIIFETLNTRGKDLQISDLVKNLFTRLLPPKTKGMDTAKENWAGILNKLSGTPVDPDTFLQHYWLSKESYVSKAGLFKEMKAKIKTANAATWLSDLSTAATTYAKIAAATEAKWTNEELPVRGSLAAMAVFRVAQATPLTLAIMRLYDAKTISLAATRRALTQIENFTYQFNAITQSRGGGGIANMYARLAQSVSGCDNSQQFATQQKEISKKLTDRVPAIDEFQVGFSRLRFNSDYTRERQLVRYTLRRLSEHFGLPIEINPATYTIEHLKPDSEWKDISEWELVGNIGNLLFVPDAVNGELGTKPFPQKLKILKERKVPLDPVVEHATEWGASQIQERASALAKIAYEQIWKV